MPRLDRVRVIVAAATLTLVASACLEAPDTIVLGPRPPRPPASLDGDAGVDLPDGAVPCESAADCDDGVDCTFDTCVDQGYCRSVTDFARCSDGKYCNGIEVCDAVRGCLPGVVPTCDDENTCTIDSCDDGLQSCVHAPRDFDHDGEADAHCPGGTDCDDFDETRATHVAEVCSDRTDNDCDEVVDEANCGKPMHDTCADVLDIGQGGTFEISLRGAVGDYTTSCGTAIDTRDVIFGFELAETSDVKLEARGILVDGKEEIASLSLQTECGVASTELQCARGFPADLRVRALPAGRYYVVAASYATHALWLSVSTSAATDPPTNMTCETALDVGGGGRFEGDFVDVGDDTLSACGVSGQPDVFYAFTLTELQDVEISAVSDELDGDLTVSVRDGCAPESVVHGCRSAGPAFTRLHQLEPGSYVIALEGPPSREVGYALEVAFLEPTPAPVGDTCDSPMPLAFGTAELVPLFDKQAEVESSCESPGPDAVFSLQLDEARDVEIRVDAEEALAVVALQLTCGDIQSERGCRTGGPLVTRLRNVPAGNYYVVVDSQTAPSVTVQVETFPPTPTTTVEGNDRCSTAFDVPATGGAFSGDTRGMLNDYGAFCGAEALSPDALFRLQLPSRKKVLAVLESGFEGVLHRVRDDRPPAEACRDWVADNCDDAVGRTGPILDEVLEPGTYYYAVDGWRDTNAGFYTFDVTVTEP